MHVMTHHQPKVGFEPPQSDLKCALILISGLPLISFSS